MGLKKWKTHPFAVYHWCAQLFESYSLASLSTHSGHEGLVASTTPLQLNVVAPYNGHDGGGKRAFQIIQVTTVPFDRHFIHIENYYGVHEAV